MCTLVSLHHSYVSTILSLCFNTYRIRAAFNLSTSHLKFLKQGTLAHALADSIWKMLAIAPRGPEKDRTTYNALMLIRYRTSFSFA